VKSLSSLIGKTSSNPAPSKMLMNDDWLWWDSIPSVPLPSTDLTSLRFQLVRLSRWLKQQGGGSTSSLPLSPYVFKSVGQGGVVKLIDINQAINILSWQLGLEWAYAVLAEVSEGGIDVLSIQDYHNIGLLAHALGDTDNTTTLICEAKKEEEDDDDEDNDDEEDEEGEEEEEEENREEPLGATTSSSFTYSISIPVSLGYRKLSQYIKNMVSRQFADDDAPQPVTEHCPICHSSMLPPSISQGWGRGVCAKGHVLERCSKTLQLIDPLEQQQTNKKNQLVVHMCRVCERSYVTTPHWYKAGYQKHAENGGGGGGGVDEELPLLMHLLCPLCLVITNKNNSNTITITNTITNNLSSPLDLGEQSKHNSSKVMKQLPLKRELVLSSSLHALSSSSLSSSTVTTISSSSSSYSFPKPPPSTLTAI
jgi:hypothetical protein